MVSLKNNMMRLLIGASFILGIALADGKVSQSTFLFCLQPTDKPLFINRDEGHTILNVGYIPKDSVLGEDEIFFDKNKDGYINLIFIQSEGYFDDIEGEWVTKLGDNTNECKELVSYGFMEYLARPELKDYTCGKLINLNMQINISFNITTIENDSTQIKSNII